MPKQLKSPRWAWLMILALVAGCALDRRLQLPELSMIRPAPREVEPVADKPRHNELPPRQAADACAAAAEEFAAHGRNEQAIVMFERARSFQPERAGIAARLAVLYDRENNAEKARSEFSVALAERPKDANLWNDFGYFLFQRQDYMQAEQAFRKAVELQPKQQRAWVNLGLALGHQNRYDESLEAFHKGASPAAAQVNLGVVLAQQGKMVEAKAALLKARALDPTLPQPAKLIELLEGDQNS